MSEYISIAIPNKDCKGMFLYCSTELNKITSTSEANKLIGKTFKIQLRTRVNGKRGKKTFTFDSSKITFLKAIESVVLEWDNLKLPTVDNLKNYTLSIEDTRKIIKAMQNYSGTTVENETFYVFET